MELVYFFAALGFISLILLVYALIGMYKEKRSKNVL